MAAVLSHSATLELDESNKVARPPFYHVRGTARPYQQDTDCATCIDATSRFRLREPYTRHAMAARVSDVAVRVLDTDGTVVVVLTHDIDVPALDVAQAFVQSGQP